MKKVLAIVLAMMLVPFTAFGLEMLEDSTLDNVTGQAGVSINLDVQVDATIDAAAWGDSDGIGAEGGYVGMSDMVITNLRVRAREDWALSGNPALIGQLQFLTIDVASDATYGGTTFVRINPGTFDITMESFTGDVALSGDTALDEVMGTMFMTDMLVRFEPNNRIDIMAHGGSGVTIDFGLLMDVSMGTLGWGDLDGLEDTVLYGVPSASLPVYTSVANATDAGYVGIADLTIDNLAITGAANIDVVTLDSAVLNAYLAGRPDPSSDPVAYADYMGAGGVALLYQIWFNANAATTTTSTSFVHMAFTDINVGIASMTGNVEIGPDATLGGGTLGDFYVGGVSATVNGWVDIFAH